MRQPYPPQRHSSLFLPSLRRRASEPLPPKLRQPYSQWPGDAHIRHTHELRRSGYTFGFREGEFEDDVQTGDYEYTRIGRALTDIRENLLTDSQGNHYLNTQDDGHCGSYTNNIRAMAGQMYGEPNLPETQSRIPTLRTEQVYVDQHNYALNRALTRHHHLRHSGGL